MYDRPSFPHRRRARAGRSRRGQTLARSLTGLGLLFTLLPAQAAVPVTTRVLGELLTAVERDAPATVVAANAPALSAELTARIERVEARVGDRVEPGEILVELDCRTYVAQLAAARASLEEMAARTAFAAGQLARARDLKTTRSISEEIVDQRRAELDSLRAQQIAQRQAIVQSELDVERCVVRAPFVAVVTARHAQLGELARPGTVLLRLVALEAPEISAELREQDVASLERAAQARFRYNGTEHPARLRTVLPVVRERQLTREARLDFTAAPAPIGGAGRLVWNDGEGRLPAEYLVRRGRTLGVFVVNGEATARFVPLPGALEGRPAAVDLPDATRLVIDGRERLADGEAVVEMPAD